eukprot:CAMPEP_0171578416 /NCGR_PEP_ID=MMETSP0961-20121227/7833_1 /TAXON_ID=87120 /ORGANISM="Aurantiochytrium limacinum, Strain ATCCMYA-1381" /LENGTH=211 /DNA_ID=CAMNT_0012134705 /DNA_START=65 /DNA_END=696 /DNA_ORIENTATION=+
MTSFKNNNNFNKIKNTPNTSSATHDNLVGKTSRIFKDKNNIHKVHISTITKLDKGNINSSQSCSNRGNQVSKVRQNPPWGQGATLEAWQSAAQKARTEGLALCSTKTLVQSRGGARPTIGGALSGSNMAPVSQASASLVSEQQQAPELPSPQNSSSPSSSSSSPKFPTGTSATKQPVDVSLSGSGAGNRRHSGSSATTPPPPLKQHPRKLK